ncbi:signal peptidase I [Kiloniella sp. b19]|uniref:signal peptidase I n=1 Tax=Kiloniella sp. GXU_MW_B19 TaxID=3141326 RepID=UPI0031D38E9D
MTEDQTPTVQEKSGWVASLISNAKTIGWALVFAFVIRTLVFEPFNIPSGSMKPTLLVGDYLFVSKMSYGLGKYSFPLLTGTLDYDGRILGEEPERGDVVVFRLPSDPTVDYIKRVVALPGETVQVRAGVLYINGEPVKRESRGERLVEDSRGFPLRVTEYLETLPGGREHLIWEVTDSGPLDNTPVFTVPEGHYFFMGDNRDNSQDSRVTRSVGPVPYENLIGRADRLFFSVGDGMDIRFSRIGQAIE